MTAKEKAEELRERCDGYVCYALVAVDEILSIKKEIWDDFHSEYFDYWQNVKTELNKK